jgi:hypothetical protein
MKVIGGSFGADGKAEIRGANIAIGSRLIGQSTIKSMTAKQHSERGFSLWALLFGLLIVVPVCTLPAGYFFGDTAGLLVGLTVLIITMVATFERVDSRLVTITTNDDKTATIQCKKKQAESLMAMAPH